MSEYIYKRQTAQNIGQSEENEKAVSGVIKSIAEDLRAIFEARAAVVGKDVAAKEMNEALNNLSAKMAILQSPW